MLEHNNKLVSDYSILNNLNDEEKASLDSESLYYYESLKVEFS
jgi:hypothetical protein